MPASAPEELDIQITTTAEVSQEDARFAREVVAWAMAHAQGPVLYSRVTLSVLKDPAVPRPALVSMRVDLNGRPVNANAAARTMPEAVNLAGRRLRTRVEHLAEYREARRRAPARSMTSGGPRPWGPAPENL
ncbi:hypothetical protein [Actinomadura rugatobispora]|uniref:HPF/RaiA family ribosome-associated protein n=1 Tax=Actinomadura rugatobispora TaxID=1994 RepID=A0ABW0ZR63_9ACTN|nr:hypothetical protein GCM10010200_094040 [Actinomadura rugatobispora]